MQVKEMIKILEKDGWHLSRQKGSHRQFVHDTKTGCVTVAGSPHDDVAVGTLLSIYKQAQIERR